MALVVANWKMHKTLSEGLELVNQLIAYIRTNPLETVQLVILPPFTYLQTIRNLLAGYTNVFIGAQNCHHQSVGPFTGEISAAMLASVGASYVLVGHSERRLHNNEGDVTIAEKINQALENHLGPIFCCGESLEIRKEKKHHTFVCQQLRTGILHLTGDQLRKAMIAYEPVWAIGTGLTPTSEDMEAMQYEIRSFLAQHYDSVLAAEIPILYGGSCNAHNVTDFVSLPSIQGVLVGKACLHIKEFLSIINSIQTYLRTNKT